MIADAISLTYPSFPMKICVGVSPAFCFIEAIGNIPITRKDI